jgi:hypothetical protein
VNAAQVNVISNTNGGQTDNIADSNTQSSVFSSTTLLSLRERSIKDAIENQCFQQNMTVNELHSLISESEQWTGCYTMIQ